MHDHRALGRPPAVRRIVVCLFTAAPQLGGCSAFGPAQSPAQGESGRGHLLARLDDAAAVVDETRSRIPDEVAAGARCVVVLPALSKGGLGAPGPGGGPEFGRGIATCRAADGWSAPTPIMAEGGWIGVRFGFEHNDVLALLTNERAVRALESGKVKVGADVSEAAGPTGTGQGRLEADVITYSRSSGVFAGFTLNGVKVQPDEDAIQALYGSHVDMDVLLGGRLRGPKVVEAARFSAAVRNAFPGPARRAPGPTVRSSIR